MDATRWKGLSSAEGRVPKQINRGGPACVGTLAGRHTDRVSGPDSTIRRKEKYIKCGS